MRTWLPLVLDSLELWISSEDLQEGVRWSNELFSHLEKSHFGILIVTPDNFTSPWMMFEAGALSKDLTRGRVVPYLIGFASSQLTGPLKHFQSIRADKVGTLRLIKAINEASSIKTDPTIIEGRFEHLWPAFADFLESICLEQTKPKEEVNKNDLDGLARLEAQLGEAMEMIRQLVGVSFPVDNSNQVLPTEPSELGALQGSWCSVDSDSHYYMRVINGQLYAPYCFGGNDRLTGVYYGWKKLGQYWFARFRWLEDSEIHGFSFLKPISSDLMDCAWWLDGPDEPDVQKIEQEGFEAIPGGEHIQWKRTTDPMPSWASDYFAERRD